MEQHDIIEELLALREEVQALKFLAGGGVISNLVSRLTELENSAIKYPSITTGTTISLGMLDDGWVTIQQNWTQTSSRETIGVTPYDCYLVCQLRACNWKEDASTPENSRTKENSQLRVYAGNMIINTSTANSASSSITSVTSNSCFLKKGVELFLKDCINPNHLNNKLLLWMWRA